LPRSSQSPGTGWVPTVGARSMRMEAQLGCPAGSGAVAAPAGAAAVEPLPPVLEDREGGATRVPGVFGCEGLAL
jgi:hypothetical protein